MSKRVPVNAIENTIAHSASWDPSSIDEGIPASERPIYGIADVCEVLKRMLSFIRRYPKPGLTVDCLYLVIGDAALMGDTITTVAGKHGATKAAVSKRVRQIRQMLHLPQSIHNKPDHVARKYSRTNASPVVVR